MLSGSGHLRVTVAEGKATIDYAVSYLPEDETEKQPNGSVAYSYTVGAAASVSPCQPRP